MRKHSRLQWSDEATEYFKKVPPFVRSMAGKGVEQYARAHGYSLITPEIIRQSKENHDKPGHGRKKRSEKNRGNLNRQTSRLHEPDQDWLAREGVDPLRYAFSKKAAVHAGAGGEHLDSALVAETWNILADKPDTNPRRTVYVHIPFCRSRCRFCGFYMYGKKECDSGEYTNALLAEIKQSSTEKAVARQVIHAVYLGGGTPSDLAAKDLYRLIQGLRQHLYLANDCEITVEGRVAGFSSEKITACLDGGANRFSIGVQSFATEIRTKMGRIHDRGRVLAMLDDLAGRNNAATVIDLIYGFPGQTMEIWEQDVSTFLNETRLDGCDMYQLNVFRGSPLDAAIEEGRLEPAADIPKQAEMFALGRRMALRQHMKRLSMNHWAWNERERNRYNSFTCFGATCIPFGCGAGGRLNGHYFFQDGNLRQYYRFVEKGEKPVATAALLPRRRPFFRELVGKMEEGAVNLRRISKIHDLDVVEIFAPLLTQWEKVGLITLDGDWLEFTEAGEFWHVTLAQKMIDYFTEIFDAKREKEAV